MTMPAAELELIATARRQGEQERKARAELVALAHAIDVELLALKRDVSNVLHRAIEIGKMLDLAKPRVPCGWLQWVEQNTEVGPSCANHFRQLAERFGHLSPSAIPEGSNLTEAIKALAARTEQAR
jgi:hypothetical protein